MREIRFNAVDEDTGEYVRFDDFIKNHDCFSDETHTERLAYFLSFYFGYKLLQYTGLKDKNGVKIYEGDLVRFNSSLEYHKIVFKKGAFQVDNISNGLTSDNHYYLGNIKLNSIEVIGNIYENKEPLND